MLFGTIEQFLNRCLPPLTEKNRISCICSVRSFLSQWRVTGVLQTYIAFFLYLVFTEVSQNRFLYITCNTNKLHISSF